MSFTIGFFLFPQMTQLDFSGPFEFLSRVPGATVHLAAKSLDPIEADTGLKFLPTITLEDCPQVDVLCVPGGPHVEEWFEDERVLGFLQRQAEGAKYVTSVCTGSLILGAAGLLKGYRATSHWSSVDFLKSFGAIPVKDRVVVDRGRISGGGVTAGIDFALTVVAELLGEPVAKSLQLALEYNPSPPFKGGHPDVAEPEVVESVTAMMEARVGIRQQHSLRAGQSAGLS